MIPRQGLKTIDEKMKRPFGDAYDKRHGSECNSLYTMRGVGGKRKRQESGFRYVDRVRDLSRSAKAIRNTHLVSGLTQRVEC